MRAYSANVGATDGNIIEAIITTHTPRNQPSAPSAVPGPSSIPAIRSAGPPHAPRPGVAAPPPPHGGEPEQPGDEAEPLARGGDRRPEAPRRRDVSDRA